MGSKLFATPVEQGILLNGQTLVSPGSTCWLTIQDDGNLVLYQGSEGKIDKPLWSSGCSFQRNGRYFCAMQSDGNLVTYYGNLEWPEKIPVWSSGTGTGEQNFYFLSVEDDYKFSIYRGVASPSQQLIWASAQLTANRPS